MKNKEVSPQNIEAKMNISIKLDEYLARGGIWRRKSRELWLKETAAILISFHSSTINKREYNRIDKSKSNYGKWLDKSEDIEEAFVEIFRKSWKPGSQEILVKYKI